MRNTFVHTVLHGSKLVGGLPRGKAGNYFSMVAAGTPLAFMFLGWEFAAIPGLVVGVLYRFNKYKYTAEPELDAIMSDYEKQADSYHPWGSRNSQERFYRRSIGFGRWL
jgi:hypothetical protein